LSGAPPARWIYACDSTNGGLSGAYNFALEKAKELESDWVLLLDQDTSLPPDFLRSLLNILDGPTLDNDTVAIVPRVFVRGRQISPVQPSIIRSAPLLPSGLATTNWVMSINSGTTLSVKFVQSIGGFTWEFWLDFLDHWVFRRIYQAGKKVLVSDVRIQHDMTISDFDLSMSVDRYRNILSAEEKFTANYLPLTWQLALPLRLMVRAAKHLVLTRQNAYSQMMMKAALRQLASFLRPRRRS
jgi:GT2 family glycosyltransferase